MPVAARRADEGDVGGGEITEQPFATELRIVLDPSDVLEHRRLPRRAADKLVIGARQHAMRRGKEEIARNCGCRAGRAAGAEDHHHGTASAIGGRRCAADHRMSGYR